MLMLCLLAVALEPPPQVTLPRAPQVTLPAPLTLEEGASLAAWRKLPLVVWVGGHTHASVEKRLPPAVHVRVDAWKGDRTPGVLVCPIHQGWPHARALIPAKRADLETVLEELSGDWLRGVRKRPMPQVIFAPPANC